MSCLQCRLALFSSSMLVMLAFCLLLFFLSELFVSYSFCDQHLSGLDLELLALFSLGHGLGYFTYLYTLRPSSSLVISTVLLVTLLLFAFLGVIPKDDVETLVFPILGSCFIFSGDAMIEDDNDFDHGNLVTTRVHSKLLAWRSCSPDDGSDENNDRHSY